MKISSCELQLLMTHGDGEAFLEAKTNSSSLQSFNLLQSNSEFF